MFENYPEINKDSIQERIHNFGTAAFAMLNDGIIKEKDLRDYMPELIEQEMYEAVKGTEDAMLLFKKCMTTVVLFSKRNIYEATMPLFKNILSIAEFEVNFKKNEALFKERCNTFRVKSRILFSRSNEDVFPATVVQHYVSQMTDGEIFIWTDARVIIKKAPDFTFTHPFMVRKGRKGSIDESVIAIKVSDESRRIINSWARDCNSDNLRYPLESYLWGFDCGFIPKGYFIKYTEKDVPIKHTDTLDTE